MKTGTIGARVLVALGFFVACNSTLASERNKAYKSQNLLALPVIAEEPSKLSESSQLPNSLSPCLDKSIEPGGTPKSVSISISFVPASTVPGNRQKHQKEIKVEQERHFHVSVEELVQLVNKLPEVGPRQSIRGLSSAKPVIVIDDEACRIKNEPIENEAAKHDVAIAKQVIARANEGSTLKNESDDKHLSKCSLLRCLCSCFGART